MPGPALATTPVHLNVMEVGYLTAIAPELYQRCRGGDPLARSLYTKLKAAAMALGVQWYYADPWPQDPNR